MKESAGKEMVRQMREMIDSRNDSLTAISPYRSGLNLLLDHDFEGALVHFNQSIELHPNFPFAYYYAGRSYLGLGRYSEAAAVLRQAIKLNPLHAPTHAHLGDIFLRQGKLAAAEKCLRKAVRLQFDNQTALKGLAELAKRKRIETKPVAELLRNAYFQGDRNPFFLMALFSLRSPDREFLFALAEDLFREKFFCRAAFFYRAALNGKSADETIHAKYKACLEKIRRSSI
jgi:tetratricopeptide (TPR) repeat protein